MVQRTTIKLEQLDRKVDKIAVVLYNPRTSLVMVSITNSVVIPVIKRIIEEDVFAALFYTEAMSRSKGILIF